MLEYGLHTLEKAYTLPELQLATATNHRACTNSPRAEGSGRWALDQNVNAATAPWRAQPVVRLDKQGQHIVHKADVDLCGPLRPGSNILEGSCVLHVMKEAVYCSCFTIQTFNMQSCCWHGLWTHSTILCYV